MKDLGIETMDGALIARAEGRIDASNSPEFEAALLAAIEDRDGPVIIDCAELSYISSAGMRAILLIAQILEERVLPFAVCSLCEEIAELFEISGFDQVIDTHGSLKEALAAVVD